MHHVDFISRLTTSTETIVRSFPKYNPVSETYFCYTIRFHCTLAWYSELQLWKAAQHNKWNSYYYLNTHQYGSMPKSADIGY